jgi:uncharacterized membrane protein YedE/YeeE
MKKLSLFFALLIFAGLIVGLGMVLRRFPTLAAAMALGPCMVTFIGAAMALLSGRFEI